MEASILSKTFMEAKLLKMSNMKVVPKPKTFMPFDNLVAPSPALFLRCLSVFASTTLFQMPTLPNTDSRLQDCH
ncbi:hypothetical protein Sjap_014905 [Stephania japonica]|uniref:Uncharacterized protein n=1 Tax=Stephania japonica TaxID=461633 RepID=A0AAP0NQW3_9MAGN